MARSKTGRAIRTIGSSTYPVSVQGSANHNFEEVKYKSTCTSGDVRGKYEDLEFASTGSGEMLRIRGIASGTLAATTGTINAIHATGQVKSGGTIGGALNAIRATLEVAGTTPTPGGTLSALQLDSNIVTGTTLPATASMCRVTQSGAVKVPNLFLLPVPGAKTAAATDLFVARHADATATHGLAVVDDAGTRYWFLLTTDTPAD